MPIISPLRLAIIQRWDEACFRAQLTKARMNSSRDVAGVLLFSWTAHCHLSLAASANSPSETAGGYVSFGEIAPALLRRDKCRDNELRGVRSDLLYIMYIIGVLVT
jgi:hypothetical protein